MPHPLRFDFVLAVVGEMHPDLNIPTISGIKVTKAANVVNAQQPIGQPPSTQRLLRFDFVLAAVDAMYPGLNTPTISGVKAAKADNVVNAWRSTKSRLWSRFGLKLALELGRELGLGGK